MRKGFPEASDPCNRKPVTDPTAAWTSPDGTAFDYRKWQSATEPRAVVIAMHGLGCRAEDFEPLSAAFNRNGITLAAWNLRGQGLDPDVSRRGAWLEVDGIKDDLRAFEATINPQNLPIVLCGESMGALLALQAAVDESWSGRIRGVMLFSPVVALAQKNPLWLKSILQLASRIFPRTRLKPGWFVHGSGAMPPLTRIEERQRYLATAPHRLGPLTLPFLTNMGDLIEGSAQAATRLDVPVAIFSGGHDVFTTTAQFEAFFSAIPAADKTHFHYDTGYHQLLFDLDATRVVEDAADWLLSRISPKSEARICP
jgi:alpha-beta hydrolase superfamily lysophospholipase